MSIISIAVGSDGAAAPAAVQLGHNGEHNANSLEFSVDELLDSATDYYRITIDRFKTEKLYSVNGKVSFSLPQSALSPGVLFLQLNGYKIADSDPVMIFKSDIIKANVKASLTAGEEIPNELEEGVESAISELEALKNDADEIIAEVNSLVADGETAYGSFVAQVNSEISTKADKATTLAGYGISDAYTKAQIDECNLQTVISGFNLDYGWQNGGAISGYSVSLPILKAGQKYTLGFTANITLNQAMQQYLWIYIGNYDENGLPDACTADALSITDFTVSATEFTCCFTPTSDMENCCFMFHSNAGDTYISSVTNITNSYLNSSASAALAVKADKSTTLAGYGITDAYTKAESDGKYLTEHQDISNKANMPNIVYSSVESYELADNKIAIIETDSALHCTPTLTLTLPSSRNIDYASEIHFISGSTATILTYPDSLKMRGDDCEDDIFVPAISRNYNILFTAATYGALGIVIGVDA